MIPKNLRDFILWKLTAVNPKETHLHTAEDLKRDGRHDLSKGVMTARALSQTLKMLVAEGRIVKKGSYYQLANKRPYKDRIPADTPPLVLTAETKAMQARMEAAAKAQRGAA